MSKHTPGPWKLGDDHRLPSGRTVVSENCVHVADVMERNSNLSTEECISNARLLSAAPRLLAALKGLVKCNEEWNAAVEAVIGRPAGWVDAYLNEARAAIAEAEGTNATQGDK